MKDTSSAIATRREAFAAAHRLSTLIDLTQDDQFLHQAVQSAAAVISRSGLFPAKPVLAYARPPRGSARTGH